MEYTAVDVDVGENFIEHHGILNMKWGRRRFQNPDGTLTAEGKIRYSREKRRQAAKNLKKARKVREANKKKEMKLEKKKAKIVAKGLDEVKKNSKLFSNEEIANLVNRNQLESRLADAANSKNVQKGKIKVDNVLDFMGKAASIADSAGRIYRNINPILEDNGVFLNRDKRNDYIYNRNNILKRRKYDAMEKEWDEAMADAKYKFLKENKNSKDLMYRLAKAEIEKDVTKTEYERDHPGDKKKMTINEATKAIDRAIDRDGNSLGVDKDDLIDFLLDNNIITQSNKKK
ncbi:MAG TPA: hypothetical protein DCR12_04815 [Lachnospiraceae bacterium]|jgi:hypothetical protein|nr:hypothetical protein [Lachnospiraceae bacterium]